MDALDAEHIWTTPLIDMRFNYKPQNPLYLLLVRAYSLAKPVTVANTPAYAGCKSWVPLDEAIDVSAVAALCSMNRTTRGAARGSSIRLPPSLLKHDRRDAGLQLVENVVALLVSLIAHIIRV